MIQTHLRSLAFMVVLLLPLHTYALDQVQQTSYEEAKKHYAAKSYAKAYATLSALYMSALDDPELNFYLGKSAYEVGEFPIALAAFERVEMLDPNNVRNQLELARTQYFLRLFSEAEDGFKKILQNPGLPENVRLNVEYYLSSIAKEEQRSFWFTTAKVGILYDSNVNFGSSNDTYTLPVLGTFNSPDSMSDSAHEETLSLVHLYDFGGKGGALVRNQLSMYNRHYRDEHAYDLRLFSYNPALVYNTQRSSYELIGGIDRLSLGGKSYYTGYSLQPKWTYSYLPSLRQTLALKMGKKSYFQSSDTELDSRSLEGMAGLEYYLSSSSAVRADLTASRQIKNSGDRIDVNYNEIGPSILYTNQLLPTTIVQAQLGFKKRLYDDYSTLFASNRVDETKSGTLTLIQRLTSAVSLEAMGNYNRTHSTMSVYSFDKYTLSMGVSARF
ncbi:MAG: surface lipoprotein assembly modifier [Sulfuricurvum sp.]